MKKILLFSVCLFALHIVSAQSVYRTYAGHLYVTGKYKGVPLEAQSHGMDILLNYETAEIEIHLDLKSLIFNNDSLRQVFLSGSDQIAFFKGKMRIPYVNTEGHPKQKFPVDGTLTINDITRPFTFKAELLHIEGKQLACQLSAEFVFSLSTFFPEMLNQGFDDHVHIKFFEIVLGRVNE